MYVTRATVGRGFAGDVLGGVIGDVIWLLTVAKSSRGDALGYVGVKSKVKLRRKQADDIKYLKAMNSSKNPVHLAQMRESS